MSLAISLSAYENTDALALSYLFIKNVEKELTAIQESARKECEIKSDDPMMKNLLDILYVELGEVRGLLGQLREELRNELPFSLEMIEPKKRELLRRVVNGLAKERVDELVLALRVVDYVLDELVIRRETFEKMSKDKLLLNLKTKIDAL